MADPTPLIKLHTIAEAAQLLGMARSTLYKALQAGEVPHRVMPGTAKVRMTDSDIDEYVSNAYRPAVA